MGTKERGPKSACRCPGAPPRIGTPDASEGCQGVHRGQGHMNMQPEVGECAGPGVARSGHQQPELLPIHTYMRIPPHRGQSGGAGSPVTSSYCAPGTRASRRRGCRVKDASSPGGQAHSVQEGFCSLLRQPAPQRDWSIRRQRQPPQA